MKKFPLFLLLAASLSTLSLSSCSNDDKDDDPLEDPCGLEDETEAFGKAVDAYTTTPNKANCQAYKQATLKYLEEARDCDLLDAKTRAELEETLLAVTSNLDCDEE